MIKTVRQFLGLEPEPPLVPAEIRRAAGELVNAAQNLSGAARELERRDPFEAFVHAMQQGPKDGKH